MATVAVHLADSTKKWIDEKVPVGEHVTSDEYLAELIERDRVLGLRKMKSVR